MQNPFFKPRPFDLYQVHAELTRQLAHRGAGMRFGKAGLIDCR